MSHELISLIEITPWYCLNFLGICLALNRGSAAYGLRFFDYDRQGPQLLPYQELQVLLLIHSLSQVSQILCVTAVTCYCCTCWYILVPISKDIFFHPERHWYIDSCHSLHLTRQEVGQASWAVSLGNHCVAGKMYYVKACGWRQQNDSSVCYLTHAEGKATCLPCLSCLLMHTH